MNARGSFFMDKRRAIKPWVTSLYPIYKYDPLEHGSGAHTHWRGRANSRIPSNFDHRVRNPSTIEPYYQPPLEGMLYCPSLESQPRCVQYSESTCSSRIDALVSSKRLRNPDRTDASKPGSSSPRPRAYFQSTRVRTAAAACSSVRCSSDCSTSTTTRHPGASAWLPATSKKRANGSSRTSSSSSRRRMARVPAGYVTRARRAVSAGIDQVWWAWVDIALPPVC